MRTVNQPHHPAESRMKILEQLISVLTALNLDTRSAATHYTLSLKPPVWGGGVRVGLGCLEVCLRQHSAAVYKH